MAGIGILIVAISLLTELVLFILIALIYLTRQLVLYLFVLLMPILIVLWIPGIGPFQLVSSFVRKIAGFYVPFLFMTIPVALLFRIGELLGNSFGLSFGGIGAWMTGLVIPILAVFAPLVLFWQAGAVFFIGDRASRHTSRHRGRDRIARSRAGAGEADHARQNFGRGRRGDPALKHDGQALLDSSESRAHRAGSRVRAGQSRLRTVFQRGNGRSPTNTSRSNNPSRSDPSAVDRPPGEGRNRSFDHLRRRSDGGKKDRGSSKDETRESSDDRPPYID